MSLWFSVASALLPCTVSVAVQPIVETQYGLLKGLLMSSRGSKRPVVAFLGVPYAQPPVGDPRLALPKPPVAWQGERDATLLGECVRMTLFSSVL